MSGGDPGVRRIFRTALYHVLVAPTPISDADGRYPGFDGRVHHLPVGGGAAQLDLRVGRLPHRIPLLALLRPDVASPGRALLHRDAVRRLAPRWPLVARTPA